MVPFSCTRSSASRPSRSSSSRIRRIFKRVRGPAAVDAGDRLLGRRHRVAAAVLVLQHPLRAGVRAESDDRPAQLVGVHRTGVCESRGQFGSADYTIANVILLPLFTIIDGRRAAFNRPWLFFVSSLFTSFAFAWAFYLATVERQRRHQLAASPVESWPDARRRRLRVEGCSTTICGSAASRSSGNTWTPR